MRFDVLAHFRDRALRRDSQDLGVQERGHGANDRCETRGKGEPGQQFPMLLRDDVVNEILRRRREHQIRQPADDHQQ